MRNTRNLKIREQNSLVNYQKPGIVGKCSKAKFCKNLARVEIGGNYESSEKLFPQKLMLDILSLLQCLILEVETRTLKRMSIVITALLVMSKGISRWSELVHFLASNYAR